MGEKRLQISEDIQKLLSDWDSDEEDNLECLPSDSNKDLGNSDADPKCLPEPKDELNDFDDIILDFKDVMINVKEAEEKICGQSNEKKERLHKTKTIGQTSKNKRIKKEIDENNKIKEKSPFPAMTVTKNFLIGENKKFVWSKEASAVAAYLFKSPNVSTVTMSSNEASTSKVDSKPGAFMREGNNNEHKSN